MLMPSAATARAVGGQRGNAADQPVCRVCGVGALAVQEPGQLGRSPVPLLTRSSSPTRARISAASPIVPASTAMCGPQSSHGLAAREVPGLGAS